MSGAVNEVIMSSYRILSKTILTFSYTKPFASQTKPITIQKLLLP